MHKLSSQLKEKLGDDYSTEKLVEMIQWLEIFGKEPSTNPFIGEDVNALLVDEWIKSGRAVAPLEQHCETR